jgi:hypothetical protein
MPLTSVWRPNPFQVKAFSISSGGDNIVVSGAAGKSVRVYRMKMLTGAAVNITMKDTTGVTLDGPLPFSANQGWILDFIGPDNPPWYGTKNGAGFVINLSSGVTVGGSVEYVLS